MQVDSLKKAFSKHNIEKKMTKIGTKLVSAEQREKIKQKTASLKFGIRKVQKCLLRNQVLMLDETADDLLGSNVLFVFSASQQLRLSASRGLC